MSSWVIEPDGYLDSVTEGVISEIGAFGESKTLMEVTFETGEQMLFPLARSQGGKWRYPKGLNPNDVVTASWTRNPAYEEGSAEPKAFFVCDR